MRKFPDPIQYAIAAFTKLPGVGPKTALRYIFRILKLSPQEINNFARAIANLNNIQTCKTCFTYSENIECDICRNPARSKNSLCVVSESRDIATLEATGAFTGNYLVLGGTLNPIEGQTPEILRVKELFDRLELQPSIQEVILAFSSDVHGETTIMYLSKKLKEKGKKVTRLARGLPIGADLEFADEITLSDALSGRRET